MNSVVNISSLNSFPLLPERILVDREVAHLEKGSQGLPAEKRHAYMKVVKQMALKILQDLGDLMLQGYSTVDLRQIAKESIARLNTSAHQLYQVGSTEELTRISMQISNLGVSQTFQLPSAPSAGDNLFSKMLQEAAARRGFFAKEHKSREPANTTIQIRIQPKPISQGSIGMPQSVYGMDITDGTETVNTEDPLNYFIAHGDSISDFDVCIEDPKVLICKSVSLPSEIKNNLLNFLKVHRDPSTWNCANFTAAAHGEYPDRPCVGKCNPADFVSGRWDIKFLGGTEPTDLKPGDFISMEGGPIGSPSHGALYLGEGLYLSKLGYDGGLTVCKLADMKRPFQRLFLYSRKKENSVGTLEKSGAGDQRRIDEALQIVLKNPKFKALWEETEKKFGQPVAVDPTTSEKAPFGCRFNFERTPAGKFVNPQINIAADLGDTDLKLCIMTELVNLSFAAEYSSLTELARQGAISKEAYVRKKEELEVYAQKKFAIPIEEDFRREGIIPPNTQTIMFTDPQLELPEYLKKLRDNHRAQDALDWERHALGTEKEPADPSPTPHSSHRTADDFFNELWHGAVAHKIGHRYGKSAERAVETVAETVSKAAPKTSTSRWRDRVVSGAAHAAIIETTALAVPLVPAFLAISGIHGVAAVASTAEPHIQQFLDTHSAEEYASPPDVMGEGPNPLQAALAVRTIFRGLQMPSKAIYSLHDKLTKIAGGILDAVGLTDETVKQAIVRLAEHPPMPDGLK